MVRSKLQPPLDQWAKWPVPNYDNPSTQPKHVLIAACVLAPITVSLVFVRLWVRLRQKNTGLDDWLMLASLVCATCLLRAERGTNHAGVPDSIDCSLSLAYAVLFQIMTSRC